MAELEADRRPTDMPTAMGSHGSSIPVRSVGSFSIPAIITGMRQVAGGRGKIDQKKAAEEMKRYAFAGLGVFDMGDIYGPAEEIYCKFLKKYLGANLVLGFMKFVARYESFYVLSLKLDKKRTQSCAVKL